MGRVREIRGPALVFRSKTECFPIIFTALTFWWQSSVVQVCRKQFKRLKEFFGGAAKVSTGIRLEYSFTCYTHYQGFCFWFLLAQFIQLHSCHWWELPQVSFLSQQKFCRDKHVHLLSWQKYACRYKTWQIFVATNTCLSWQNFYHNKLTFLLLWQAHVCHDKTCLKNMLAAIKLCLLFCHDKSFVMTNVFVTTNICHDKSFVATK